MVVQAFNEIEADYLPPISAIVVQKKHSTRMFPGSNAPTDRSGNVLPGTVVDHTVTSLGGFNFFLVSHAGLQGTSRPTHYHVLMDQCGFGPDLIELMTYWMTYTFARCSRFSIARIYPSVSLSVPNHASFFFQICLNLYCAINMSICWAVVLAKCLAFSN